MAKMTPVDRGSETGNNPYNKRKVWDDENKTGTAFQSADDAMAQVRRPRVAVMDKMENTGEPATTEEPLEVTGEQAPQEEERYSKVDYKKRYDDLKRHYDKKVKEFKTAENKLKESIASAEPKYTPPSTPEELEEFKQQNPSLYNVVETVAHMRSNEEVTRLQDELKTVKQSLQAEEAERAYAELKTLVPDFEQIRKSEDFHEWAEQQPEEIQRWVYENRTDVRLAANAINLYKASKGMQQPATQPPEDTPKPRASGADEQVTTKASREEPSSQEKVWTTQQIASLTTTQFEQYRDEIDKAFAEGRVVRS